MYRFVLSFFIFLFLSTVTFAHGTNFFEFAPDVSETLQIFYYQVPSQSFFVQNDSFDGVDIWIDNTGASGYATFEIRDLQNTLKATKTVTIPQTPIQYGGTRFHVDFGNPIPVQLNELYKLRIISSIPSLRIYTADIFQLLAHNASGEETYNVEPAQLGSSEQGFAFKFALYESQDILPPVISSATTTNLSPTSVRIDFIANEAVDFRVDYGVSGETNQSTNYNGSYTNCFEASDPCVLTILVNSGIIYNYTIFAKDEWGNEGTFTGSFESAEGAPSVLSEENTLTLCSDTIDNDNDGLIDLTDPDCVAFIPPTPPGEDPSDPPSDPTPSTENTAILCSDGIDNDSDGLIDLNDSDCSAFIPPPPPGEDPLIPPPPAFEPPVTPPSGGGSGSELSSPTTENEETIIVTIDEISTSAIAIQWDLLAGATGYRIDVYNENNELERQLIVSAETRELILTKLGPGKYRLFIYANKDGKLIPIGEPIDFLIQLASTESPFSRGRIIILIGLSVAVFGGLGLFLEMKRKKKKFKLKPLSRSKSIFD